MGEKSEPWEIDLYRAVDEVLFYIWDPIGASCAPEARDEYQAYLPQVYGLLAEGALDAEIASYLGSVTEYMGLSPNSKHDAEVVEVLLRWRSIINERYT